MSNPGKNAKIKRAENLYKAFSGHEVTHERSIIKPEIPDIGLEIGNVLGIMYETVRDGKREKYLHEFAKHARPLFVVSHDGRQLLMIGGSYNFTERGIVDKRPR